MILSAHQPQYLPWLGYFDKIDKSDCFVFLDTVQYKKREFQNRNKIRTKTDSIWLTVPVKTKGASLQRLSDVQIDNEIDWQKEHINSLQTWYASAPYFSDYFSFFKEVYAKKWEKLIDLNIQIIKFILDVLNIKTKIYLESEIKTINVSTLRLIELCKKLDADIYLSGIGGKEYLDAAEFTKNRIDLQYQNFEHPNYLQQFTSAKKDFYPYLSMVDLLFNAGPKSIEILRKGNS
ncbi:MAG: WbqC family protein [Candidatus Omnitrophica bacterium]|nr:WbqC family protein [Candidatus Omnitrophota bacterium]